MVSSPGIRAIEVHLVRPALSAFAAFAAFVALGLTAPPAAADTPESPAATPVAPAATPVAPAAPAATPAASTAPAAPAAPAAPKAVDTAPEPPAAAPPATVPGDPVKVASLPPEPPSVRWRLPSWMPSVDIEPGLDVIAAYALKVTPGEGSAPTGWFHSFEMARAMASLRVAVGPAAAALTLEGVYSASEGALTGVAGDSFVMRVREARVGYRHETWLSVDAGIVPTFTVPLLDQAFGLRALGPVSGELTGFTAPADLGIVGKVHLPAGYGFVGVGAYNGEGYTNRELNRGKNIEVAALVRPVPRGFFAPFGVYGAYTNGSSGTGASRADRVTAALLWEGDRVRGGAAFTYALGVRDDGTREAFSVDWSLRVEPVSRFILGARGFVYARDVRDGDDRILSVTGLVGYRIAAPLEAFLALTRQLPEAATRSALPGSDFWEGRAAARFLF